MKYRLERCLGGEWELVSEHATLEEAGDALKWKAMNYVGMAFRIN